MGQLFVASEYTEPSDQVGEILRKLASHKADEEDGLLLITKKPSECEQIVNFGIPTVVHSTITGFAGTILEPNLSPDWRREMFWSGLLRSKKNVKDVVLRIDPLIPGYTSKIVLITLLKAAKAEGITRVRVSVIDYYAHVRRKFDLAGLDHNSRFQPDPPVKKNLLERLVRLAVDEGMQVESCAEDEDVFGLNKLGCANSVDWPKLDKGPGQRKTCFCDVDKMDLLPKFPTCSAGCLYCYWGKDR